MNSTPLHVIFGTGAIGLATLDALLRRDRASRTRKGVGDGAL